MKKLLLFLTIFSSASFAFNDHIDLKLELKPKYITSYDWCKQKAHDFVREKRQKVLRLLNMRNEKEWKDTKINLECIYKEAIVNKYSSDSKRELFNTIQKSIMNILDHPYVKKELEITRIRKINGIIVAERLNNLPIKFLSANHKKPGSVASTDGYNIYISPEIYIAKNHSALMLEACIGHELGHVACKHIIEKFCFSHAYSTQVAQKTTKVSRKEFENAINEWSRAMESQADIVGTFNNWMWVEQLSLFFKKFISGGSDPLHPSPIQRFNYLRNIYLSIQKDSTPTKKSTKKSPPKKPKKQTKKANKQPKNNKKTNKKSKQSYKVEKFDPKNAIRKTFKIGNNKTNNTSSHNNASPATVFACLKSFIGKVTVKKTLIFTVVFVALYSFFFK
ncbi:M48 family metalloprotease [Candidatus Dependentiae bacterium]